jgi:tetratricopeptide (TPR) repeat protein
MTSLPNPFRGLRPFEADEAELFFGRKAETAALLDRIHHYRFLAVVGSSGCGKSSLVRAGVIAALRGASDDDGGGWRIAVMRPGDRPIAALAAALRAPGARGRDPSDVGASLGVTLRRGGLGIVEAFRQSSLPDGARLFILVDQFEELFRFASGPKVPRATDEATAFVTLLLEACAQREFDIYAALTMRSEYLGLCDLFPGLPDAINEGIYLVPRMAREQIREAIEEPIRRSGGDIAERLVDRLLNDLGLLERPLKKPDDDRSTAARGEDVARRAPDQLPVLQHALTCLWNEWAADPARPPRIDLEHYDRVGRLGVSLSKHADACLNDVEKRVRRARPIAERLFRRLTESTADGHWIRRPAPLGDILRATDAPRDETVAVIDAFRAEGRSFLMPPPGEPLDDDVMIDISHESLIRQWQTLQRWTVAEAAMADVYRRLTDGAARWSPRRRRDDLWRGAGLDEAIEWQKTQHPTAPWAERYGGDFALAAEFLRRSRRWHWYRRKLLAPALVVLAFALLSVVIYGSWQIFQTYTDLGSIVRVRAAGRELVQSTRVDQGDLALWVRAQLLWGDPKEAVKALETVTPEAAASLLQQLGSASLRRPRSPRDPRLDPVIALDLARRFAASIPDPIERGRVLTMTALTLLEAGRVDMADEIARTLDDPAMKTRLLILFARQSPAGALAIADRAYQAALGIQSQELRASALVEIADVLKRLDVPDKARATAEEAYRLATGPNVQTSDALVVVSVIALIYAGRLDEAERAARAIAKDSSASDRALELVAREHARAGRIQRALDVGGGAAEYRRESMWFGIALELTSIGRVDDALEIVRRITSTSLKNQALLSLALQLVAEQRLEDTRRAAAGISEPSVRVAAAIELARAGLFG